MPIQKKKYYKNVYQNNWGFENYYYYNIINDHSIIVSFEIWTLFFFFLTKRFKLSWYYKVKVKLLSMSRHILKLYISMTTIAFHNAWIVILKLINSVWVCILTNSTILIIFHCCQNGIKSPARDYNVPGSSTSKIFTGMKQAYIVSS